MWFEELMDDCKQGLELARKNPAIFLPYVIEILLIIVLVVLSLVVGVISAISTAVIAENSPMGYLAILMLFLPAILFGALVFSALQAFIEAGSFKMFAAAAGGEKPGGVHFWAGAGRYFLRMWGIKLFLALMILLLSPVLLLVLIPYALTIGILTAGWGLWLLVVLWAVYFSAWPAAVVVDDLGAFKALGAGVRLGRRYFWGMFILGLAGLMLGQYFGTAFGFLITLIAGWLIGIIVRVYFKLVVLLVYKRRREDLPAR